MQKIKVRKIRNSLGVILAKDSGIKKGEFLFYQKISSIIQLALFESQKAHDRNLIEERGSFWNTVYSDFNRGLDKILTYVTVPNVRKINTYS